MTDDRIDLIDHLTGREVAVPKDVLSVVEAADRVLVEQMASIQHLGLHTSWCGFEERPSDGWVVRLDVYTSEYSYGQEARIADLRSPEKAKEFVREVLWDFATRYSTAIGEQIRKIRSDLKELLGAGAS